MATSFAKTAPCFSGSAISVPDCRSGTPGVPGNNHAMQGHSGRSGKKSCRGTSDEGNPVFGIGFPSAWNIHPWMNDLFRSQGSGREVIPKIPALIRGHFDLRSPLPEGIMATSLVKTAPHFPGTVISVPDCRSGTHGVPGNIHAMQRYSGRSAKKSC